MKAHPLRTVLHDEVHTRPRPHVSAPHAVVHVSILHPRRGHQGLPEGLLRWFDEQGLPRPSTGQSHIDAESGPLRIKWERHGEFDDLTVYAAGSLPEDPFAAGPADALMKRLLQTNAPEDMASSGEVIAALRIAVLATPPTPSPDFNRALALKSFATGSVVGATISDNDAAVYGDFHLDDQGYGRFLVQDQATHPGQMGRAVQRIIEIEVYRMMSMLAFPEARRMANELDRAEVALSALVARLDVAPESEEPELLRELTGLSASVEQLSTSTAFRMSAARAYRTLVRQRGIELRQGRLPGLQTLTEFLERRFEPAMAYCDAVTTRMGAISERISRASALLGTRVEIERERQNQALLGAMNRRAELQLRLQETVEGLSVAAIAYYATGLMGYLFKGAADAGLPLDPEVATGIAVVPIVIAAALGLRAARKRLNQRSAKRESNSGQ
ncbi:MAG: DUF3422 family protein [Burkholderiaceae bacterium]